MTNEALLINLTEANLNLALWVRVDWPGQHDPVFDVEEAWRPHNRPRETTWMVRLRGEKFLTQVRVRHGMSSPGQGWATVVPAMVDPTDGSPSQTGLFRYDHALWARQEVLRLEASDRVANPAKKDLPPEWHVETEPDCTRFGSMLLERWRAGDVTAACLNHLGQTLWQLTPEGRAMAGKPATQAIKDGGGAVQERLRRGDETLNPLLARVGTDVGEIARLCAAYPDKLAKPLRAAA